MKIFTKRRLITIFLAVAIILSSFTIVLAQTTERATLLFRGITISLDGEIINPRDVNDNPIEPFIIAGTTYLPIRALAGALGLYVEWVDATSTINLTSGATPTPATLPGVPRPQSHLTREATLLFRDIDINLDGQPLVPRDVAGNVVEPFIIDGTTYLPLRALANALGLGVDWVDATSTVVLTTDEPVTPPPPQGQPGNWTGFEDFANYWVELDGIRLTPQLTIEEFLNRGMTLGDNYDILDNPVAANTSILGAINFQYLEIPDVAWLNERWRPALAVILQPSGPTATTIRNMTVASIAIEDGTVRAFDDIRLPGGLQMRETTLAEALALFGEPRERAEGTWGTTLNYWPFRDVVGGTGPRFDTGFTLTFNTDDVLTRVVIRWQYR